MERKIITPVLLVILFGIAVFFSFQFSDWKDIPGLIHPFREPMPIDKFNTKTNSTVSKEETNAQQILIDNSKRKLIYVHGHQSVQNGDLIFQKLHCIVKTCDITTDITEGEEADLIILGDIVSVPPIPPFPRKSRDQIWAVQILEAPGHEPKLRNYKGMINWTITYRSDSTFSLPYFRFRYYAEPELRPELPNFSEGKKKKVAWLVSNFNPQYRLRYFQELSKYIQADRVTEDCPRVKMEECLEKIGRDYKFYFAAENLFCKEYMTEKVGRNAYKYNMIPILLGARREDYMKRLPSNSYIFAEDYKSPRHLADYLHKLDQNDTLYNTFFQYKKFLYVEEEFAHPWCEICSRLHMHGMKPSWYNDLNQWWSKDACRSPPWQILPK